MCNKLTLVTIFLWPDLRGAFRSIHFYCLWLISVRSIGGKMKRKAIYIEREREKKWQKWSWKKFQVNQDSVSVINGIYYYSLFLYELFFSEYIKSNRNECCFFFLLYIIQTENAGGSKYNVQVRTTTKFTQKWNVFVYTLRKG